MQRKNWILITVASLGITFSLPTFAQENRPGYEKVRMNDIPNEAQQAIKKEANGKEIKELVSITRNNRTWYQARIEDKGGDKYVSVGRDGKVQNVADADDNNRNNRADNYANNNNNNRNNNDLPQGYRRVEMNDLPNECRQAIRQEANGKEIKELVSIERNNRVFYQARVEDRGADKYIAVGRDGKVLNVADADGGRPALSNDRNDNRDNRADNRRRDRRTSFEGWQRDKIDPDRLPGEVKRTLGENDVKLDRLSEAWTARRDGKTVYHVIEKGPTRETHYVVDENGRFLGEDNVTPEGRDRIEFDRLPGEAKTTLQRFGKPGDFRRIVTITDRNQTWYEARHENGEIYRVGRSGELVDREGDELRR